MMFVHECSLSLLLTHFGTVSTCVSTVPDGDDRERDVCTSCGFVNYVNPKVIVGCVVAHEDKVLLVKRNNAPRLGYWTLPAGFMETNETVEAGAEREVWEEAGAKVKAGDLLAYMSVPHISQVHLYHSATFVDESSPDITPGPEAMDVRMFTQDEIPWEDLAFPSVEHALQLHFGKAPPPTYSTTLAPPTWLAKK